MEREKWRFKLASQERCERLKRSFGGWRTIMLYLRPAEQVSLQGLDHWNYDTGVPRAQTNMPVRGEVYYFLRDVWRGQIDSLEVPSNRVRTQTVKGIGPGYGAVQTRIGLIVVGRNTTFLVTKSKDSDELLKAPRTAPPFQHQEFALTFFGDRHLVYHSSCSLGDFTYVIAGFDGRRMTKSIERLNAKESILETACSSLTHQWERVQVSGAMLKRCQNPLVCQLNDKELLILGGLGNNRRRALALHHESLELRLLSDGLSMPVEAEFNQGVKLNNNKVAARVCNGDGQNCVIIYTPEEPDKIQIVKDLGSKYDDY